MRDLDLIHAEKEKDNCSLLLGILRKMNFRRGASLPQTVSLDRIFSLRVVSRPKKPVLTGKNRHKFPNPRKDCFVQVSVGDLSTCNGFKKNLLPFDLKDINKKPIPAEQDTSFSVDLLSVRRMCDESNVPLPDEKDGQFCLHCPLAAHRKMPKDSNKATKFGFWFRFFGEKAKFVVTVALKLEVYDGAVRTGFETGSHVLSSVEFEIVTKERMKARSKNLVNGKVKVETKRTATVKLKPVLYPEFYHQTIYQEVISSLRNLIDFCQWKDFECASDMHIEATRNRDPDLTVAVLLEQSVAACYQCQFDKAKCILKSSLELMPKCKNKSLLVGRAYLYLSLVHSAEKNFGNAEECLFIANQQLGHLQPCEDRAMLQYLKALVVLEFIPKMPRGIKQLKKEASERLQEAVDCWKADGKVNQTKYVSNHHLAVAAMCLCELDVFGLDKGLVEKAKENLDLVETFYNVLPIRTKCEYLSQRSGLLSYQGAVQDSTRCIEEMVVIATNNQLPLELRSAEEKLVRIQSKIDNSIFCDDTHDTVDNQSDVLIQTHADGYNGDLSSDFE